MKFIEKNWLWLAIAAIAIWWLFIRQKPVVDGRKRFIPTRRFSSTGDPILEIVRAGESIDMGNIPGYSKRTA